jgi:hypothetical protein
MQYNTKRKIKKIVVYGGLLLIGFIIGSCFSDASLFKEIDSGVDFIDHTNLSKIIGVGNSKLSIGDTGVSDGLEMTVVDVKLINPGEIDWYFIFVDEHHKPIDSNAKLLLVDIKVENVGKTATDRNTLLRENFPVGADKSDIISVYYAGQKMKDVTFFPYSGNSKFMGYNVFNGYGSQYPGVIIAGVVGFEVPKNIDLNNAVLEIHGLHWSLG